MVLAPWEAVSGLLPVPSELTFVPAKSSWG